MCGISGLIGLKPVNLATLDAMTNILAHRGPDDAGTWASSDRRQALGHRRLSIIDTSDGGHQPMVRGGQVVTFNGEIYNYLEVREHLIAEGAVFTSKSDTEVLLAAYQMWGDGFLDELNGMFAFAILDNDRHRLICARDRYGEKPFLFHASETRFAFASEYKALLPLAGVPSSINEVRLFRFLDDPSRGLDDSRQTVFAGIQQLLPGEVLTLDLNDLSYSIRRYWTLKPDDNVRGLNETDAQAQFRDLLTDSVRIRMRSDVPLGSCLSGGLDSSSVVCIGRRLVGADPVYDTFTGRFKGSDRDESEWADIVASHAHTRQHIADPTPDGLLEDVAGFIWTNELPVGSTSQYAQWSVFELAKASGTTVLLDGQGGDELLGGYEQYFEAYLAALHATGDDADIGQETKRIRDRYPAALLTGKQRSLRRLPPAVRHLAAGLSGSGSDFKFGVRWPLSRRLAPPDDPGADRPRGLNQLTEALFEDSFRTNLPVLLRYGDRNSMAHSREVRLPFCDHRLAEFVFSLPPRMLMGGGQTKRLLRGAMRGIVPDTILDRWNKQGFVPPQSDWFQRSLGPLAREIIESTDFRQSDMWRATWWRSVLKRHDQGDNYAANLLWRPVIETLWRRHFVSRIAAMPRLPFFAD